MGLLEEARDESKRFRVTPMRDAILAALGEHAAEFDTAMRDPNVTTLGLARVVNRRLAANGSDLKASEQTLRRWRKELDG